MREHFYIMQLYHGLLRLLSGKVEFHILDGF